MFGRPSRLPIDSLLPNNEQDENSSYGEFVTKWKDSMNEAFRIANKNISVEIVPGDKVLVKNVRDSCGTEKLRSHCEQNIYEVVSKHQDIPVYKIKQVGDNRARTRTIHRNLLKLCNELPLELLEKPSHRGGGGG